VKDIRLGLVGAFWGMVCLGAFSLFTPIDTKGIVLAATVVTVAWLALTYDNESTEET
jgi:cobalamin synthase